MRGRRPTRGGKSPAQQDGKGHEADKKNTRGETETASAEQPDAQNSLEITN